MIIENKDILGFKVGNEEVCGNCITEVEEAGLTADDVYRVGEIEKNDMVFCDRCGELLW